MGSKATEGFKLVLRRMTISDFDAYFDMKCDPDDVRMSGFAAAPQRDRLKHWFEQELKKPESIMFIAVSDASMTRCMGYLFVRVVGEHGMEAEISYGVRADFRGGRCGQSMISHAVSYVRQYIPKVSRIVCWVATDNAASIKNVVAAGYRDSGETRQGQFLAPTPHERAMRKFIIDIER